MYEFVVLSLLMNGPMHGYGIRVVMNRMLGPYRTIAWGPLYSTLHKLQAHGLIIPLQPGSDNPAAESPGPPSKHYQITDTGRLRFQELMRVPEHRHPDYQFHFGLRLCRLGLVEPPQRLALLRDYLDYCDDYLAYLNHALIDHETDPPKPPNLKPWILLTLDRRRAIWEADRAWIQTQINEMEALAAADCPANTDR